MKLSMPFKHLLFFILCLSVAQGSKAESQEQQVDFYMTEARAAKQKGDYQFACELSTHASELAIHSMKGVMREREATQFKQEVCKIAIAKRMEKERELHAALLRERAEEKQRHQALCKKYYPAYRVALDGCATALHIPRCMGIKFGSDNVDLLQSLSRCGG